MRHIFHHMLTAAGFCIVVMGLAMNNQWTVFGSALIVSGFVMEVGLRIQLQLESQNKLLKQAIHEHRKTTTVQPPPQPWPHFWCMVVLCA